MVCIACKTEQSTVKIKHPELRRILSQHWKEEIRNSVHSVIFPAIARTMQVFRRWDATWRWIISLKILEKFTVSDSSSFVGTQLGNTEKDICTFTTFDWLGRINRNAFFYSMKALYALHRRHFCHTAAHECLTIRVNLASRLSWEMASCSQKCSNTRKNLLSICCSCHIENSEIPLSSQ